MRTKHFIALFIVFLLLISFNLCGLFSFLNNWSFDQLAKWDSKRPISSDIVAIRVQPHDDLEALIDQVQNTEFKSLTLLMLNSSGTLTSNIFGSNGDALQFKSTVQPPDSLTWRGPEDMSILKHKLEAICQSQIKLEDSIYLDFSTKNIPHLEAHQVVSGQIKAEHFKNKIVIIGDHFASQTRFYSSPIHQGDQALTALSKEVLVVNAAVNQSWVTRWPNGISFALAFVVVAGLIVSFKLRPYMHFKRLIFGLLIGICITTFALLKLAHVWLPPASLLFTVAASGLILYLASYSEWKETLLKIVRNFEQQHTALLVFSSKGLLKYHSDITEKLFASQHIAPQETSIKWLLKQYTNFDSEEINQMVKSLIENQTPIEQLILINQDSYLLAIHPLEDDYIATIENLSVAIPHHQKPSLKQSFCELKGY